MALVNFVLNSIPSAGDLHCTEHKRAVQACLSDSDIRLVLHPLVCIQELELLEQRGQGIKTKAETQAKYGW